MRSALPARLAGPGTARSVAAGAIFGCRPPLLIRPAKDVKRFSKITLANRHCGGHNVLVAEATRLDGRLGSIDLPGAPKGGLSSPNQFQAVNTGQYFFNQLYSFELSRRCFYGLSNRRASWVKLLTPEQQGMRRRWSANLLPPDRKAVTQTVPCLGKLNGSKRSTVGCNKPCRAQGKSGLGNLTEVIVQDNDSYT
jgi:hypothetical protein